MNRPILLTGATSGIGLATTQELSARGYGVFAGYRNPRHRTALADLPGVHPLQIDVSDAMSIERAVAEIDDAVGPDGLYAVINNAGITYTAPIEYADVERAREVIDVNLMAPYLVARACVPLLRRHNDSSPIKARVINVASWAAYMAAPFIGFYNASKAGLVGLTESMYYDLGLLDIHAVLAAPGVTKTPLHSKTTSGALAALEEMPAESRTFYGPYLEHFASMGGGSGESKMLLTPEQAAHRIVRIVDAPRPRFQYNLSPDAKVIHWILSRFVPFRVRAALNRRMYGLDSLDGQSSTTPALLPEDRSVPCWRAPSDVKSMT